MKNVYTSQTRPLPGVRSLMGKAVPLMSFVASSAIFLKKMKFKNYLVCQRPIRDALDVLSLWHYKIGDISSAG